MHNETLLAQRLVQAARAIEQALRDYELTDKDPHIDLNTGRTIFASSDTVLEGYILDLSVQHPTDEKSRLSFTIYLDDKFQRTQDDVLSIAEAAVLGMET